MKFISTSFFVSLWILSPRAEAAISTYFDKTDFQNATGAEATEPFPKLGPVGNSFTLGNFTFSGADGTCGMDCGWSGTIGDGAPDPFTPLIPGNQLGICGVENLDIQSSKFLTAIGYDFAEPEFNGFVNARFVDSTFRVEVFNDSTSLGYFEYNAPNDEAFFVGIASDEAFNRLEIREIIGANENEFWGQFYSTTTPEPLSSTLFLLGGSLLMMRKKIKSLICTVKSTGRVRDDGN